MDCAQFENIVHDLERPGTEGYELRDIALEHAEACSRCARLISASESLDVGLRALATHEAGHQAPAHIEPALIAEFRRQKAASSRRRVQRQIAALGAAAAVLLALGVGLHRWTSTRVQPVANAVGKTPSSPVAAPANSSQQELVAENVADDSADTSNFVRLPYADDPQALENGAVVRVELTEPALVSLGMPATLAGTSGSVPADLVVSADGTPQAIRFVSQENESEDF
jgi:hypothetical protein